MIQSADLLLVSRDRIRFLGKPVCLHRANAQEQTEQKDREFHKDSGVKGLAGLFLREPDLLEGLMPAAAFVEELTTGAMHPRRRDEVRVLQSLEVRLHLAEQPGLLFCPHGRHLGDDDFRILEFDQVMQLHAGLGLTCVMAVEKRIAAGLDLRGMSYLFRVWSGSGGLVVDDLFLLNQIEDADQFG
jgi:hypothetical protein